MAFSNEEAILIYSGKTGEIFSSNDITIENQEKLDDLIDLVNRKKATLGGRSLKINVFMALLMDFGKQPPDGTLADQRCQLLKTAFEANCSIPATCHVTNLPLLDELESYAASNSSSYLDFQDKLLLLMVPEKKHRINEHEQGDELVPWQQEIIRKYEQIIAGTTPCPTIRSTCLEKYGCPEVGLQGTPETSECMAKVRGSGATIIDSAISWGQTSQCYHPHSGETLQQVQYLLEKIGTLQKTSEAVWELAQEVAKHNPEAPAFTYDPKVLESEIENQKKGIMHYLRGNKQLDFLIEQMLQAREGEAHDIWYTHGILEAQAISASDFYRRWTLHESIEHIRLLHSFVRQHVGLAPLMGRTSDPPLCVQALLPIYPYDCHGETKREEEENCLSTIYSLERSMNLPPLMEKYNISRAPLERE